ncbi:MAG: hypothetical protein RAK25_06645 [TACK group archaeon]|nr:hypothetical protein [TACK group archaeon]
MAAEPGLNVDVKVDHERSIFILLKQLWDPVSAFQRFPREKIGSESVMLLALIGLLGLGNELVLLSKVYLGELPPLGLYGPAMIINLFSQVAPEAYLYYFFESAVFAFLEAIFNFFVLWVSIKLIGRVSAITGDEKLLMGFTFLSLFPMVLTGAVSLLPTALLPNIMIGAGQTSAVYMSYLARNPYYTSWEVLGWIGEIWSALLAAISVKVSHSVSVKQDFLLISVLMVATLLRIYFVF